MKKISLILLSFLIGLPLSVMPVLAANTYTAQQVGAHNTAADCWMIINNNVYNLTTFIPTHSGGSFISSRCGLDGTALFNSGPHAAGDLNVLNPLLIGTLITLNLTSVVVTPATPALVTGGTVQLTATPEDQTGATFAGATTTFVSSNSAIATVSNTGLVTGVSQGSATITATSVSGSTSVTGTSVVTVTAPVQIPVLTNVTVSPLTASIIVGATQQLTVATVDQNGTAITSTLTYSSSDPAKATIDNNGLVSAISPGTSTITVTAVNGTTTLSGTATITVTAIPVLTNISITPTSTSIIASSTQQLAVATTDQTAAPIAATLSFASDNTAVATVDNTGLVTGVSAGLATITVSAVNGTTTISGTSAITVTLSPIVAFTANPTSVVITKASALISSTNGKADNNAAVDSVVSTGIIPIQITINNTGGDYPNNLRINALSANSHIQLWAKDSLGDWYDLNVTGWGPSTGFAAPSNFNLITSVYPVSDTTGSYPLNFNLISVNNLAVVATTTATVNVETLAPVDLGSAGNFAILAKTGITEIPTSSIIGNIGASPITGASIIGLNASDVTGTIYTVDTAGPAGSVASSSLLTTAVNDMEAAYTNAAGRTAGTGAFLNVGGGTLTGLTLAPGVYTWGTDVTVPTDLTLAGGPNDVWIFQISGNFNLAAAKHIILTGGATPGNIFWQVAGQAVMGVDSVFNGNILGQTGIDLQTGATLNGRALAQTAVSLDHATVSIPNPAPSTITAFNFSVGSGTIDQTSHTILVNVPAGTDVATLTPTISITGISVTPNSGVAQNFTNPVKYTVTAVDGTILNYLVTVAVLPAPVTSGGGGGGGGYTPVSFCNDVTYGPWKLGTDGIEYRDVISQTPNFCSLTNNQQEARSRITGTTVTPTTPSTPTNPQVLGETKYANGALLKGSNDKIYVIIDNKLVYISSLKELAKYKGAILKVSDSVIANFTANNVSGVTNYINGTLLRNNNKIYVVVNNKLIYIPSLKELAKHKGQILNVDSATINNYLKNNYPNGTLIRATNDKKIYVILEGKKMYIKSLTELQKYKGKILNISASELSNY